VNGDAPHDDLLKRARRLTEDLNLSTPGWRIPSDRLIDDFAAAEHGLRAQEHELTELDGSTGGHPPRRAFSLFPLEVDATTAELVALLLEPDEHQPLTGTGTRALRFHRRRVMGAV
jgi:hypothetical protein